MRPKYDVTFGQFLGLVETLGYLIVRGDDRECYFDYGYNKGNSKVLYSTHEMKIANSFSSTIFSRHRIQDEPGVLLDTDSSKIFFFLPSATDRIEGINQH